MGFLRTIVPALVWVVAVAGVCLEARAWVHDDSDDTAQHVSLGGAGISMDQAVKLAEQRFKAKVVRAETQHDGPRTVYILKLLNDAGHVWTVRVDAADGNVR